MQAVFNQILAEQAVERPGTGIGDDHQFKRGVHDAG
jgi:hypothetical protein